MHINNLITVDSPAETIMEKNIALIINKSPLTMSRIKFQSFCLNTLIERGALKRVKPELN
jgi:hypothetical protein